MRAFLHIGNLYFHTRFVPINVSLFALFVINKIVFTTLNFDTLHQKLILLKSTLNFHGFRDMVIQYSPYLKSIVHSISNAFMPPKQIELIKKYSSLHTVI